MAYFAELDENNIVKQVIAIANSDLLDQNENESEAIGIARCKQLFGENTIWLQTSYNTYANVHRDGKVPFRKNFAAIGYSYDAQRDAFIEQQPEDANYTLDENTCTWRNILMEQAMASVQTGVTRV